MPIGQAEGNERASPTHTLTERWKRTVKRRGNGEETEKNRWVESANRTDRFSANYKKPFELHVGSLDHSLSKIENALFTILR